MATTVYWRKFRALSWGERFLLLRGVILLPFVALALRWFGVRRCQAFLGRLIPATTVSATDANVESARGVARLIRIAATRGFYTANCLQRSLLLWWWLRRRGMPVEIRYGGDNRDRQFAAHAWIEFGEHVIGDDAEVRQQFATFERRGEEVRR